MDTLLNGGVESGSITEFFGEGGSGKTNICFQLSKNVALKDKKSVYLDTEGVSMKRLKQIAGDQTDKVMKNVLFFKAHSFEEQEDSLEKISNLIFQNNMDVGLVVVDSLTLFYRTLLKKEGEDDISSRLGRQLVELMKIARKKDLPVVITSHVYESGNGKKSVGGHMLYHMAKTIILLEIMAPQVRKGTIIKHRSQPENQNMKFRITRDGVRSLE